MMFTFLSLSLVATYLTVAYASTGYLNWTTFNGNGVNLGGWLEQESTIDTEWWAQYSGGEADEWGLCAYQGSQCGPVLERRYATWITTTDIDELAEAGISILRIPTTYAAWVKVPGSQLYSGNQVSFLNSISSYAVSKHSMHIIIDVHSLPGGVNGMPFGEAEGHYGWFNNQTALNYSLQAIDAVISFVQNSGFPQAFTIEPINEPVDNTDITAFGTPAALSESGASWVLKYVQEVIAKVQATNPKIPVMFQGSFKGEEYWSSSFPVGTNLVFDVHNYYFSGRPTASSNVETYICSDAKAGVGDGKFPVFTGEWSIQVASNNTLASRKDILNAGLHAFSTYGHGSSYWTAKFTGNTTVSGEGTQSDYWNYETFIALALIDPSEGAKYCT